MKSVAFSADTRKVRQSMGQHSYGSVTVFVIAVFVNLAKTAPAGKIPYVAHYISFIAFYAFEGGPRLSKFSVKYKGSNYKHSNRTI